MSSATPSNWADWPTPTNAGMLVENSAPLFWASTPWPELSAKLPSNEYARATGSVMLPAGPSMKPRAAVPWFQSVSSNEGQIQESPRLSFEATSQRAGELRLMNCCSGGGPAASSAKLIEPGVPPPRALTRQFSERLLALNFAFLASEPPEPAAAIGQGAWLL